MADPILAEPVKVDPIPNPVLKEDFADAKANFRQQMEAISPKKEEGGDALLDQKTIPEHGPSSDAASTVPPVDAAEVKDKPDKVLPDDVLEPKAPEPEKQDDVVAEIEKMELPKNASAKSIAHFADLKKKTIERVSAAQAKISELEKRLSEAATNKEAEALREKLKAAETKASEIEDQWAKAALETSPQFQRKFVKREQQAIEAAKSYLEGTEVDPRVIDYAAHNAGAVRLKILEDAGLDPKQIGAVEARLAQYDSIQRDKSEAIDNWREQGAKWQEAEQERVKAEQAKRTEFEAKVWEKVIGKNATLLPFRSSKDETWNSQAEQFRTEAKDIFLGKGADPETMADVVQRGVVAKSGFYDKIIEHLTKENKQQKERIAKLESAAPGGVITSTSGTAPSTDKSKMSREELSKLTFNEQLAAAKA
jgi:hypothetical protein